MRTRARKTTISILALLGAAALFAACDDGNGNEGDAVTHEIPETADPDAAEDPPGDEARPEGDVPQDDVTQEEAPPDLPVEETGECTENVPPESDVLNDSGQFLVDEDGVAMNENTFCAAGQVTFTVGNVPADEIADLHTGAKEYALIFALSSTASRNYIQAMLVRQEDNDTSPIVVKVGGGTCIDCVCCDCVLDPAMGDGWCASEVYRGQCEELGNTTETRTFTIIWDSDLHNIWYKRDEEGVHEFAKDIPVPFAFNKYCAMGQGCDMMHWGPSRWSSGTIDPATVKFACTQPITAAPASCP